MNLPERAKMILVDAVEDIFRYPEALMRDFKEQEPEMYKDYVMMALRENLFPSYATPEDVQHHVSIRSAIPYSEWAEIIAEAFEIEGVFDARSVAGRTDELIEFLFANVDLMTIDIKLLVRAEEWIEENPNIEFFERYVSAFFERYEPYQIEQIIKDDPDIEVRVMEAFEAQGYQRPSDNTDIKQYIETLENIRLTNGSYGFAEQYYQEAGKVGFIEYLNDERNFAKWTANNEFDYEVVLKILETETEGNDGDNIDDIAERLNASYDFQKLVTVDKEYGLINETAIDILRDNGIAISSDDEPKWVVNEGGKPGKDAFIELADIYIDEYKDNTTVEEFADWSMYKVLLETQGVFPMVDIDFSEYEDEDEDDYSIAAGYIEDSFNINEFIKVAEEYVNLLDEAREEAINQYPEHNFDNFSENDYKIVEKQWSREKVCEFLGAAYIDGYDDDSSLEDFVQYDMYRIAIDEYTIYEFIEFEIFNPNDAELSEY